MKAALLFSQSERSNIFKCIIKLNRIITKCDSLFYYKVRQVLLQSVTASLLQSATSYNKCYYKVRQVLQNATRLLQSEIVGITKRRDPFHLLMAAA